MSTAASAVLLLAFVLATALTIPAAARHHGRHHEGGDGGFEEVFDRQEADRVEALPGQPAGVGFRQFSGYVTVNATHGRALFYWFFEAAHHVSKKPLVLWLNGGPGCSSLGYGALQELGPLQTQKGTPELSLNPNSWNKEANLLFLEQPAGVGFSYTNTSADLTNFGDDLATHDAYTFLVNWFERFPQFKGHDFYLSGESYAGHYVPQLAEKILEKNKKLHKSSQINLKGYLIGNPAIDEGSDSRGTVDYTWDHALVADEVHAAVIEHCKFDDDDHPRHHNPLVCGVALHYLYHGFKDIDLYSLYTPLCTANSTARRLRRWSYHINTDNNNNTKTHGQLRLRLLYDAYDPCQDQYTKAYLNRRDVQHALHANTSGTIPYRWSGCSDTVFHNWQDAPKSTLPAIKKAVEAGLRVWVYSGDTDGVVPVTGTRRALTKLGLKLVKEWREWFTSDQVGGFTLGYERLTFVTVRGAGHMVPTLKPVQAGQLFAHFLAGKDLPPKPIVG